MVSNDDFDVKATHLNCFYLHINFEQKYPKPAIVYNRPHVASRPIYLHHVKAKAKAKSFIFIFSLCSMTLYYII